MSRAENARRVAELAAQGLNGLQIAERLGISRSHAYELLTDPDGSKRRQVKPQGICVDCGKKTSYVTGGVAERCRKCAPRHVYATGDPAHVRRRRERAQRIEAWWAEGLTLPEIAQRLGWTANHVNVEMVHLRKKGYDLPYRREPRKAVAA